MSEEKVSEKKTMKKKLIHDLIELVIWVALLWMCFWYIQTHPAEKVSFFSWYKVIYQQTEILFQEIFGKNGDFLREKYSLESYYEALITLSEEKPCVDSGVVSELQEVYSELQNEPKNTLNHTLPYYIDKQRYFDGILTAECESVNDNSTLEVPELVTEMSSWAEIL